MVALLLLNFPAKSRELLVELSRAHPIAAIVIIIINIERKKIEVRMTTFHQSILTCDTSLFRNEPSDRTKISHTRTKSDRRLVT